MAESPHEEQPRDGATDPDAVDTVVDTMISLGIVVKDPESFRERAKNGLLSPEELATFSFIQRERKAREEERKTLEAAEARAKQAEAVAEQERKAREDAQFMEVLSFLARELPRGEKDDIVSQPEVVLEPDQASADDDALRQSAPRSGRSKDSRSSRLTERKTFARHLPSRMLPWDSFASEMDKLTTDATGKKMSFLEPFQKNVITIKTEMDAVPYIYYHIQAPVFTALKAVYGSAHALHTLEKANQVKSGAGIPDCTISVLPEQSRTRLDITVEEYKYIHVNFEEKTPAHEVMNELERHLASSGTRDNPEMYVEKKNLICVIVQTYTYMYANNRIYGLFCNWNQWFFLKRTLGDDGEEVLLVSPCIGCDKALRAYAALIACAARDPQGTLRQGTVRSIPRWLYAGTKNDQKDGDSAGQGPPGPSASSSSSTCAGSSSAASSAQLGLRKATCREDVEMCYPEMTTQEALGIQAVWFHPSSRELSNTDKSTTYRLQVGDQDLVARLVDYLGVPKITEFTYEDLDEMETNEIFVYDYLSSVQGILVPHFKYHGSDFNQIWATAVTTYEGPSLDRLIATNKGKLLVEIKRCALATLRELHSCGVLHGDIALRNCVWNEANRRVLWVDFEVASVREDFSSDPARFEEKALAEVQRLTDLLEEVGDLDTSEPSPQVHDDEPSSSSSSDADFDDDADVDDPSSRGRNEENEIEGSPTSEPDMSHNEPALPTVDRQPPMKKPRRFAPREVCPCPQEHDQVKGDPTPRSSKMKFTLNFFCSLSPS